MGTTRRNLKPGTLFRYDRGPDLVWEVTKEPGPASRGSWNGQCVISSHNPGKWLDRSVTVLEVPPDGPEDAIPAADVAAMHKSILTTDKKARKEMPIARGVVDYFPRALAAVANVSFVANQQHNPGEPMHWDKSKSTDHADCIARHLIERGAIDDDGLRHSAKLAWRALALLETELSGEGQ